MRRFLKHIGIVVVAVVCLSSVLAAGSLWALRQGNFYKPSFLVNSVAETDFDYIILGSSTGLTTLNTAVIDSISQSKGLNLSIDDTDLSSQYLMLQHFLAEGKRASYCIVAPPNTSYDIKNNLLSPNDYRFLPYINRAYVHEHFSQFSSTPGRLLAYSEWLPFLGVSYYNAELFYPSIVSALNPEKRNRFNMDGNYTYPPRDMLNESITQRTTFEVDFSNVYLKAIKALCDQHGIRLICYLSPMKSRKANIINTEYNSINHSDLLNSTFYFYDDIHVNSLGRQRCSEAFGQQFLNLKQADE